MDEAAFITSQSGPDRQRAFLRCWTAKWAYFKVRGLGLTTAAQNQVRVVGEEEVHAPRGLNVVPVAPTLDAIAMVAVYGSTRKIETWSWLSPFNP